ncbi:transcriptional regulator, TetR family [Actinomadura glauciflava]|uniref:GntR family transcriptional regulator n=1 Tax=Actinomadura luteofluorescens TaxID=46163 RepID=UPI00216423AF|nr:GntR family transcriptional regulator [Actinomadura glauciflava]MCR3740399.1 transcriptional regulator, TetR family [Actinomadura glauciflava]
MSATRRPDPPYLVIAAEIRSRIESGELRPGDRVPSIRQIAERWGVAVATATRAAAVLREQGLVEPRVGAGTVVSAAGPRESPRPAGEPAKRTRLLEAAIAIADAEGIEAVSIRRLGAHLGVRPMSLYQSITSKEELLMHMADHVFGEVILPAKGPAGWRAKLEFIARAEWELCRRHLWLPKTVSFMRPLFAPNMMAHTEWVLRALDGLGLSMEIRVREALTIHSIAVAAAGSLAEDDYTGNTTGTSLHRWNPTPPVREWKTVNRTRFPLLSAVSQGTAEDLEGLFEYALARHLDGLAAMLADC